MEPQDFTVEGWAFETSNFGWLPDIAFWEKCGFNRGTARGWDECITDPGFGYYCPVTRQPMGPSHVLASGSPCS